MPRHFSPPTDSDESSGSDDATSYKRVKSKVATVNRSRSPVKSSKQSLPTNTGSKTPPSKSNRRQCESRSFTPPPSTSRCDNSQDRINRLELLVEKLIEHNVAQKPASLKAYVRPDCIPEFNPGNAVLSCSK